MTPRIGYLIGSHVAYQHNALPHLLNSILPQIERDRIVIVVNGSAETREYQDGYNGLHWCFATQEAASHFNPIADHKWRSRGFTHWFYLNCTSWVGPDFRQLVESGFDPNAHATLAGGLLPIPRSGRGKQGRAINDLAMYRDDYLFSMRGEIAKMTDWRCDDGVFEWEGLLYALAPKQAHYPSLGHAVMGMHDLYNTGTMRIIEYYPGIDLFRAKSNWGQINPARKKTGA
jgi:hypothetical protein